MNHLCNLLAAKSAKRWFALLELLVMSEMLTRTALLTWTIAKIPIKYFIRKTGKFKCSLFLICSILSAHFFWCCTCFPLLMFSVPSRHGERIGFSYLVSQKYTGDSSAIKVLRDSKILNFNIKLASNRRLIPAHNKGRPPSYFIIAGFVFTTVSVPYLRSEVRCLLQNLVPPLSQ